VLRWMASLTAQPKPRARVALLVEGTCGSARLCMRQLRGAVRSCARGYMHLGAWCALGRALAGARLQCQQQLSMLAVSAAAEADPLQACCTMQAVAELWCCGILALSMHALHASKSRWCGALVLRMHLHPWDEAIGFLCQGSVAHRRKVCTGVAVAMCTNKLCACVKCALCRCHE
jgi:hypothetical protein